MFRAGFGMVANYIIGAFGAVILAICGVAFMDFHKQAVAAGVPASEFGLSGWAQSFAERGKEAARRAQLHARREGPMNSYFPQDVAGWTRLDWNQGFDDMLAPPDRAKPEWEAEFMADIENDPSFKALMAVDKAAGSLREMSRSNGIAVYIKGGKIAMFRARVLPGKTGLTGGLAAALSAQAPGHNRRLVKAYSGVGYYQTGHFKNNSGGKTRRLKATLGEIVEISVKTNASVAEIDSILRRISYAELKALADVQEDASDGQQRDLMAAIRRQEIEHKRKANEERLRIEERLEREKLFARGKDITEVCIDVKGQQHCAWVD